MHHEISHSKHTREPSSFSAYSCYIGYNSDLPHLVRNSGNKQQELKLLMNRFRIRIAIERFE